MLDGKALTYVGGLAFFVALLRLRAGLATAARFDPRLLAALFVVSFALMLGGTRRASGGWAGITLEAHWLIAFSAVALCAVEIVSYAHGTRVHWSILTGRGRLLGATSSALGFVCAAVAVSMWCRSHPGPWRRFKARVGLGRVSSALPAVEDQRAATRSIPAVRAIERALPAFPVGSIAGVRRIVLADADPYSKKRDRGAFARYVPSGTSAQAEIHIYFHQLASMPDDLTHSQPYLTWVLLNAIGHELFHHEVIAGKRRRPKFSSEQEVADERGEQLANLAVRRLFNPLRLDLEWDRVRRRLAQTRPDTFKGSAKQS